MKTLLRFLAIPALVALVLVTLAPSYNPGNPVVLSRNACANLYLNETPGSGTFSQQFYVPPDSYQPTANLSFEFRFASNPGATMNYQVQDADTDATGNYVTVPSAGTLTSCPQTAGGSYTCRIELNPWRALYGRIYTNTANGNSVALTAQVCR